MHRILATEGIVLGKRGTAEANTSVALLTRELGLLRASARSARQGSSKLRYGLEPLTLARFSLVRGRHEWRLTGVEEVSRAYFAKEALWRQKTGRVARLLLRLIHGEEPVPELFDTVAQGFGAMASAASLEQVESIELVLVLRALAHLGYLPQVPELAPFIDRQAEGFSPELFTRAHAARTTLVRAINESLSATGL